MGQFDLKKYLVENKLNYNSRLVKEDSLQAEKPKVITKKEWDRAHKDFKGIINDKPYMMYFDKETQSTVYGPVTVKGLVVKETKVSESLSLAKSQRIIDGDAVGWIKKKNGKIEFVREFNTLKNGLMWQAKTGKKLLQKGDVQIVGVASKERWEKRKAKFPHQYSESVNEANVVGKAVFDDRKGKLVQFDLKKYLVENKLTSNSRLVKENFLQANDKSIEILDYKFPNMTIKQNGKVYEIEFDDYEIMDSFGNEGSDGLYYGYDQYGGNWDMEVYFDYHGEIEEVFPETIQKGMGHDLKTNEESTASNLKNEYYARENIEIVKDNFSKDNTITIKDKDTGKEHTIFFDESEVMDSHGNEGSDVAYYGVDQDGTEWTMDAVESWFGDLDDYFPETIEKRY